MLDFVTICPSKISSIAIGQRAALFRSDMTAARTWMHRMKSPVAIFMVLLLVAIKAMVASETLHEAVCDHQHGQHEEQRDAQQPQHECVVKLFSQGMVDSTDSSTPLPPICRSASSPPTFPSFPPGALRQSSSLNPVGAGLITRGAFAS